MANISSGTCQRYTPYDTVPSAASGRQAKARARGERSCASASAAITSAKPVAAGRSRTICISVESGARS